MSKDVNLNLCIVFIYIYFARFLILNTNSNLYLKIFLLSHINSVMLFALLSTFRLVLWWKSVFFISKKMVQFYHDITASYFKHNKCYIACVFPSGSYKKNHHLNNLIMNHITKLPVTILFAKHHFKHLPVNNISVICHSNSAVWIMSRKFEFKFKTTILKHKCFKQPMGNRIQSFGWELKHVV